MASSDISSSSRTDRHLHKQKSLRNESGYHTTNDVTRQLNYGDAPKNGVGRLLDDVLRGKTPISAVRGKRPMTMDERTITYSRNAHMGLRGRWVGWDRRGPADHPCSPAPASDYPLGSYYGAISR